MINPQVRPVYTIKYGSSCDLAKKSGKGQTNLLLIKPLRYEVTRDGIKAGKVALDAVWVSYADLDVVLLLETRIRIEILTFPENTPHAIIGWLADFLIHKMESLNYGAVQSSQKKIFFFTNRHV